MSQNCLIYQIQVSHCLSAQYRRSIIIIMFIYIYNPCFDVQ